MGHTARRVAGPWTSTVHGPPAHPAGKGFACSPRRVGSGDGEILARSDGSVTAWPVWTHAEDAVDQVAPWLREMATGV